jgi:exonuclease III
MKLSILSCFVREMTIPSHKQLVRVLHREKPDVVFLQEVKSTGFELQNRMSYVWTANHA